ncbi:MAG: SGNH/GDSL hydrolase family protein [Adhaeribacter sp.]
MRQIKPHVDLLVLTGRKLGPSPLATWAQQDAFAGFTPKPGKYQLSLGDVPVSKTVSSHSFISTPELSVTKPANTIRIVFLGESSTAGTGKNLADAETWPYKTIQLLKAKLPGINIEFINAAVGGYTSFESYGRLWSRVRFFQPDIILVNHGWNDMYYFDDNKNMLLLNTDAAGDWNLDKPQYKLALYQPHFLDPYIAWSQLLSHLRIKYANPIQTGEVKPESEPVPLKATFGKKGLPVFRTNLQLIKSAAQIMGAELFVIKQPTLIVPNLPEQEQKRCGYYLHGFNHEAHLAAYQAIYAIIDSEIPNDHVMNLTTLSGKPALFYDHVHPTPAGTSAYADLVTVQILPFLMKTAKSY